MTCKHCGRPIYMDGGAHGSGYWMHSRPFADESNGYYCEAWMWQIKEGRRNAAPREEEMPKKPVHQPGAAIPFPRVDLNKQTSAELMKSTDPSQDDEGAIVAYECKDCETAIECNHYDAAGEVIKRDTIDQCPLCQGTNIGPLTKAQYDAGYKDDGSDDFDPSERERLT